MVVKPSDSFKEFEQWVHQIEREVPVELLIDIVSARLRRARDRDYYDLALMLKYFMVRAERDREALEILEEVIKRYPDDVRAPIGKAWRFYISSDFEEALRAIDLALERAYRTGFFRREALGDKARILLKLGRGEELSRVLEEIMSLRITKDVPDIGRERDFVDRAPPGMIRAEVLARYNEFRPRRPGDSDEPPEFEPPDDAE